MRPQYYIPRRIDDVTLQLFRRLDWKDTARLATPPVIAGFATSGIGLLPQVTSTAVTVGIVLAAVLVGLVLALARVHGLPLDVYLYRGAEYLIRRWTPDA